MSTVTEFNGDPVFDIAAQHWPEREAGWQGRLSDLLEAVTAVLADQVLAGAMDDDELEDTLSDLRSATYEIEEAAWAMRQFVRERRKVTP